MKIEQSLKVDLKRLFHDYYFFLALEPNVWFPKIIFTAKNLLKAII